MTERPAKYWIIVASRDHVVSGVAQGIAQACHGKAAPLKRMKKDDFVVFYSSKQTINLPEKCQAFTAIGRLIDDETFDFQVSPDFCPSRRKVEFLPCKEVSIVPLIDDLEFISNKKSWGYPSRFGILEINAHDFELISSQMLHEEYV